MSQETLARGLDSVTRQRLLGWMLARFTLWTVSLGIAIGLDGLGDDLSVVARRGLYLTAAVAFGWAVVSAAWFSRSSSWLGSRQPLNSCWRYKALLSIETLASRQ